MGVLGTFPHFPNPTYNLPYIVGTVLPTIRISLRHFRVHGDRDLALLPLSLLGRHLLLRSRQISLPNIRPTTILRIAKENFLGLIVVGIQVV